MSRKTSTNHPQDRTGEAIDWLNSVGEEMIDAGVDAEGLADIAISATQEMYGECTVSREDLIDAAMDLGA